MIKNKRLLLPAALAVASCLSTAARAQTTATWLSPTSGNWTDPTMWSTNPYYPNSDNPSATTYDAVIDATGTGGQYTVYSNSPTAISLDSLTVNSAQASVYFFSLTANSVSLQNGTLGIEEANVSNISTGGGTSLNLMQGQVGTLSITGGLNLDTQTVTFTNGIYLNNATVNWTHTATEHAGFAGDQSIDGNGTIIFAPPTQSLTQSSSITLSCATSSNVTIGTGVTMVSPQLIGIGGNFLNRGSLVTQSATDNINLDTIQNAGHITATTGTVKIWNLTNTGDVSLTNLSSPSLLNITNQGTFEVTGGSSTINYLNNSGAFTVTSSTLKLQNFSTITPVSFVNSNVSVDGTLDTSLINRTGGTLSVVGTLHNVGTLNLDHLGQLLNEGTIDGGTITGTNPNLLVLEGGCTLSNLTLDVPVTANSVALNLGGAVSLNNVRLTASGTASGSGYNVTLQPNSTLNGTGQVTLTSAQMMLGKGSSIGAGITVAVSSGSIAGNFNNQGTVLIPAGSSLRLNVDSFSNPGAVQLNGGTLILGNSSTNVGVMPTDVQQNLVRNGGLVLLGGTYDFAGKTIDLTNTPLGQVDLLPLAITGGTLVSPGRSPNFYPSNGTTALNGVTFATNVTMLGDSAGRTTNINVGANGLTLNGSTLDLQSAIMTFNGNTLGGSGTVVFDAGPSYRDEVDQVVIGSGITLIAGTRSGSIGFPSYSQSLSINNGTISNGTNGNWMTIAGSGFVNNGTIQAANGGGVAMQFPLTNNGTINVNNSTLELFGPIDWTAVSSMSFTNAKLTISGSLDNSGKTLAVQESGRILQISPTGSIIGGTIAAPNGGSLSFVGQTPGLTLYPQSYNSAHLSNVTLSAPANVYKGASVGFSSVDIGAPVTVSSGGLLQLGGNTIVNQPITDVGGMLQLDSISNNSTISAIQNSTVRLTSWSQNLGNLTLNDSVLQIPNFTTSAALIESISRINSPVELAYMNITGQTLTLDRAPEWYIGPAAITGGEIIASQSTPLLAGGPNGYISGQVLNGVTLKGPLQIGWQRYLSVQNSLILDNGQIVLIGAGDASLGSSFILGGLAAYSNQPAQVSGTGEIIFNNDPAHDGVGSGLIGGLTGYALTIGNGITIHNGDGNGVLTGMLVSNGTVSASITYKSISIADTISSSRGRLSNGISFQNNGTLMAVNGGTLNVDQAGLKNFSAGTLIGGTYEAFDNSIINFTNTSASASITTNNANVLLSGPNSHFDAINALSANLGHFSVLGGRAFTTAGDLSNAGTVSVDDQSLLTVSGGLSLGNTSVLDVTLGASHGTMIEVQGSANLDGQLQIELANGFVPASGDQFAFMTAGSFNGNFTSFDLPTLPGSEAWDTSQASAGIISVTPEPSMLGITGLLSASLLLRRRRLGNLWTGS